ncbi:hypothetical protein V6N13_148667 [Hibiscus sabdariffa]|uniref:Uncharacterized protein n=1 Tax=Hibiscus sabdariffa TaxID=183260 RepID=A0ABR2EJQ6_9ROSI
MTPNFVEDKISSKEKVDIEMGNRLSEDTGYSLPEILRNLDFDDLEDEMMINQEDEMMINQEEGSPLDSLFLDRQDVEQSVVFSNIPGYGMAKTDQSAAFQTEVGEFMESCTEKNVTDTSEKPRT